MELTQTVPIVAELDSELVGAYPLLARRLTLILHNSDDAQDMAQAAFTRALERRHHFRGGDVRAWLYTIGIRLALNEVRRKGRLVALDDAPEPAWAMTSQPDLWIALGELDPRHRAALVLSTLDGYTHAEIAAMLEVREGTVSSWLSRSKEHLRSILGDEQ